MLVVNVDSIYDTDGEMQMTIPWNYMSYLSLNNEHLVILHDDLWFI